MTKNKQQAYTDSNSSLHLKPPEYPFKYRIPEQRDLIGILDRVFGFIERSTPFQVINKHTGRIIPDFDDGPEQAMIEPGMFRLISYEWGITYSALIYAGEVHGNKAYTGYSLDRLEQICEIASRFIHPGKAGSVEGLNIKSLTAPGSLDDSGSMCAALIRAKTQGLGPVADPVIDRLRDFITKRQHRLGDGIFARNRPLPDTLWLDDLYMSVTALAQAGQSNGDQGFLEDAVKQVRGYHNRLFNAEKRIYRHGQFRDIPSCPDFSWARANGWAIMALVELLERLPESHPERGKLLEILREHFRGLASYQSGKGLWHQLIDRNDSFLETSASAMIVFAMAKSINRGWISPLVFGPIALLGWNGLEAKVNSNGELEGTCVGTGMGFDAAFYYHRPVSPFAAHGYGPFILACAEISRLLAGFEFEMVENAILCRP